MLKRDDSIAMTIHCQETTKQNNETNIVGRHKTYLKGEDKQGVVTLNKHFSKIRLESFSIKKKIKSNSNAILIFFE